MYLPRPNALLIIKKRGEIIEDHEGRANTFSLLMEQDGSPTEHILAAHGTDRSLTEQILTADGTGRSPTEQILAAHGTVQSPTEHFLAAQGTGRIWCSHRTFVGNRYAKSCTSVVSQL